MEITVKPGSIPIYRRELITMGVCGLFLPASFISDEKSLTEMVPSKGYQPFVRLKVRSGEKSGNGMTANKRPSAFPDSKGIAASESIRMVRDLLLDILAARKYGFIDGEYYISLKTAFIAESESKIRILYLPYRYQSIEDFRDGIREIVRWLKQSVPEQYQDYMETLDHVLNRKGYDLRAAAVISEKLMKEARYV